MKNLKAIIFDLDDTLYNEQDYVNSGYSCVANFISPKIHVEASVVFEDLKALFLNKTPNVLGHYLSLFSQSTVTENECVQIYRAHLPSIHLNPKIIETLNFIKSQKYKMAIITDGRPEGQRQKIKALGLENWFDTILITDELGGPEYRKPNALPYQKVLQQLNVNPQDAAYIGDNVSKDFVTANKLGMVTIEVVNSKGLYKGLNYPNEYQAKLKIYHLSDLLELLSTHSDLPK